MKIYPKPGRGYEVLLKIIALLIAVMVINMAAMALTNICPPPESLAAATLVPGLIHPWPFSDPDAGVGLSEETGSAAGEVSDTAAAEDD